MDKKLLSLISIWNHNIHLVNKKGYQNKTHTELFQYCVDKFIEHNGSINLEKIIFEIEKNRQIVDKQVIDSIHFIKLLHHLYHYNIKEKSLNDKYVYDGQNNRDFFQVRVKRDLVIKDSKIEPKKVKQKDIDFYIASQYMESYEQKPYIQNYEYKFIFYQINLYSNSVYRINKWYEIIKLSKTPIDIDKFSFLQNLYKFFKDFNKLNTEYERLEFWYNAYKEDERFQHFNNYFKKENITIFGENLISLFQDDYFKSLVDIFNEKIKKSINRSEFIKIQIKENKDLLKKPDKFKYFGEQGYFEVYSDLVNSKREDYYYEIEYSKLAGETEGIIKFIDYLENLIIGVERKKVIIDNIDDKVLLPLEIFENTRGYLKKNANQINICYKYKAYDACFVLLRKVTEILIIELYEKESLEEKIKDDDGYYFMLGKLITSFQNEIKFKNYFSRNIKDYLPKIKSNGDLSAHNRKYNARKNDIDILRNEFRVVFEELINSIY